ncbi:MAG: peptidoglycan-associated lipoprotein Pal [Proteobacteria bacterium]|nr:peptidoglycan-associated lipoprotein Pal [Pseudomonadota bacterium]
MKIIKKLTVVILICSVMVACKPKDKKVIDTDTDNNIADVSDTDTTTSPLTSFTVDGQTFYDICCDPEHLDNPESLLSQRVILFAYDQATVESKYRDIIAIHAKYLSQNPSAKMVLEGHADERGTPEYNLALGERRGNSVISLMSAQGASPGQISVVSFGEEKPVALCSDNSCWSQNRRVRIVYTTK